LTGTPQAGGSWSNVGLVYTYTVNAIAPCTGSSSASVTVSEQQAPNAGTDGALAICQGSTVSVAELFAALGGTPDATGTWSPALAGAGTYTYTVAATAPCAVNATSTVTVSEQTAPDAGTNGTVTICQGSTVTTAELFAALGGTPDATGTWSPALAGAGTYTYTVAATAPCVANSTAQVELTISPCEIIIPTAFTPNGDNANDEWEIIGLDEQYLENQVFVYNRWGTLIYQSTQGDYMSNPWDGTHNLKPLPVGSYYYIILLNEGSIPLKGTITLIME
jgi:gliding motility-associated-like protein